MANFSLRFQFQRRFVGPAAGIFLEPRPALGVHQVEVKIVYSADLQLRLEQGPDFRLGFKEVVGQLVGQNVPIPGIPGGEAGFDGLLTLTADVAVGRVKIVEARRQKGIHHPGGLGNVHLVADHGQSHHAKTKSFLNFRKYRFHIHVSFTFCCWNALSQDNCSLVDSE